MYTSGMQLHPRFISNIQNTYANEGAVWLSQLPAQIAELTNRWQIQFIQPLSDLSYNFVALVRYRANNAILKIAPPAHQLFREAECLKHFSSSAPLIYAQSETPNALLMEKLDPGASLKKLVLANQDEIATRLICQIILSLPKQAMTEAHFPHLATLPTALFNLEHHFDAKLLAQAQTWFRDLTSVSPQDVLLHGDLHHDNILQHGAHWKIIDPHGYRGDPAAEVGAMIRNPLDYLHHHAEMQKIVARRLSIMKEMLPFDPQKIKAWAFCMTVLSAAWNIEDQTSTTEFEATVANAINQTKF